jgi:hypothetical protein
MKKSELQQIIREEVSKVLTRENNNTKNIFARQINNWIEQHQTKYEKFIDSLFLGKNIKATAMKWDVPGNRWKEYEIRGIKKTKIQGGYFYTEVSVQDENNNWYTLHSDKPADYIKN